MRNLPVAFKTYLASDTPTLVTCWKITRQDGVIQKFTDADVDIIVSGETYSATTGYTSTAIALMSGSLESNADVEGFIDDVNIKEADLASGIYNHAAVYAFQVNPDDTAMGRLDLIKGYIGEIRYERDQFTTTLLSKTRLLVQQNNVATSPRCRAVFGDAKCTVNKATYTTTGTVTGVTSRRQFIATVVNPALNFSAGEMSWTTGLNAGRGIEVRSWNSGTGEIQLFLPMPYNITAGDTFSIVQGCDGLAATCKNVYNNAPNFRGEPVIPGADAQMARIRQNT